MSWLTEKHIMNIPKKKHIMNKMTHLRILFHSVKHRLFPKTIAHLQNEREMVKKKNLLRI